MKLNILLFCNIPNSSQDARTIIDHIDSFNHYSTHNIWIHSGTGKIPDNLDLELFDVILIHYSIYIPWNNYLDLDSKLKIKRFKGLKVIFIQDEYRRIDLMIDTLNFLDMDILFTCFPEHESNKIYPENRIPGISKYSNLTGYIPETLFNIKKIKPIKERSVDVGYRARKVPYVLGRLSYEKSSIVDDWHVNSKKFNVNLKTDLSYEESQRKYGSAWIEFLISCKVNLGVESGASVMDFSGNLEIQIEKFLIDNPNAKFQEVHDKFLKDHEGKYYLNQISPRCFEAIILKTGLVLFEGNYSGILEPWRHYIPLKKDFSNFLEVVDLIKQDDYIQKMVDLTYDEIGCNQAYTYKTFVKNVDNIIEKEFLLRNKKIKNHLFNFKDIFELIDKKDNLILEKDNLILEKDNLILEKDNLILEKDNLILEKNMNSAVNKKVSYNRVKRFYAHVDLMLTGIYFIFLKIFKKIIIFLIKNFFKKLPFNQKIIIKKYVKKIFQMYAKDYSYFYNKFQQFLID